MIVVTRAVCAQCGAVLQVNGEPETGDLYVEVGDNGEVKATALCKSAAWCELNRVARDG